MRNDQTYIQKNGYQMLESKIGFYKLEPIQKPNSVKKCSHFPAWVCNSLLTTITRQTSGFIYSIKCRSHKKYQTLKHSVSGLYKLF